ncbi:MAG: hypothetical protein HC927_01805 [Deltaproteobacteria bacterium]|nr:hypothetical protein [Deltaproteobacteria bacterium]
MRVHVHPQVGDLPARGVDIRLIPRASALLSTGLIIALLLFLAVVLGGTFASLRLTLVDTVLGIGSLGFLTLASKLASSYARANWPSHLPYWGIPLLLPRALLTVALTLGLVVGVVRWQTTSVHNGTEAPLELALPARNQPDKLLPGHMLSVVRPVDDLRENLPQYLGEANDERFCVVELGYDEGRDGDSSKADDRDTCNEPTRRHVMGRLARLFAPPVLQLRCRWKTWPNLTVAQVETLDGKPLAGLPTDRVRIKPDASCQLPERQVALLRITEMVGRQAVGIHGWYRAHYPWEINGAIDELAHLAIEGASADTWLRVSAIQQQPDGSERDDEREYEEPMLLDEALLGVSGATNRIPVPVPVSARAAKLVVEVGRSGGPNDFDRDATLTCGRTPAPETHFRAVHVPGGGEGIDGLKRVAASSSSRRDWHSLWTATSQVHGGVWLCPVLAGHDSLPEKPGEFLLDKLVVHVAPEALIERLYLDVPREWMARRIELRVETQAGEPPLVATLDCDFSSEAATTVRLGTLTLSSSALEHGITALELDVPRRRWSSKYEVAASNQQPAYPWACWPAEAEDQLRATAKTAKGPTGATVQLEAATVTLQPTTCWLQRQADRQSRPAVCTKPRLATSDELEDMRRQKRGVGCEQLQICE